MKRSLLLGSLFTALMAGSATAEIEAIIPPGGQYLPAMNLPKLPKVIGFLPNPSASMLEHARVLLPQGKTLNDTDILISATAYPQSVMRGSPTLDNFIQAIQQSDAQSDPGRKAVEAKPITDRAGRKLRVFTFQGGDGGAGEVAYGSETSNGAAYFTAFTISARNAVALSNNMASFRDLMANYQ